MENVKKELKQMKVMRHHTVTPHVLAFLDDLVDPEVLHDGLSQSMTEVIVTELLWWLNGALDEPFPQPRNDDAR